MKYFLLLITSLFISIAIFSQNDLTHSSNSFVDDYAGIIDANHSASINNKIIDFRKRSTVQIAIVTVTSLNDKPIADFTRELATRWGVGGKSNNGLMILIAPNERKWRIEVGTGLEGDLPDVLTKQLAEKIFPRNFKQKEYGQGIEEYIDEIIKVIDPQAKALAAEEAAKRAKIFNENSKAFGRFMWNFFCFGSLFGIILFFWFRNKRLKRELAKRLQALSNKMVSLSNRVQKSINVVNQNLDYNQAMKDLLQSLNRLNQTINETSITSLTEKTVEATEAKLIDLEQKVQEALVKARNWKNAKDRLLSIPSIINDNNLEVSFAIRDYDQLRGKAPEFLPTSLVPDLKNIKSKVQSDLLLLQTELKAAIESEKDSKFNAIIAKINSTQTIFKSAITQFNSTLMAVQHNLSRVDIFDKEMKNKINSHSNTIENRSCVSDASRNAYSKSIPTLFSMLGSFALISSLSEKLKYADLIERLYMEASAPSTRDIALYNKQQQEIQRKKVEEVARKKREQEKREAELKRQSRNSYTSFSSYNNSSRDDDDSSSRNDSSSSSTDSFSYDGGSFSGGGSDGSW